MKIFGHEISLSVHRVTPEDVTRSSAIVVTRAESARPRIRTFAVSRGILDDFIYPEPTPGNDLELMAVTKFISEQEKMIVNSGCWSICELDDVMKILRIPFSPATQETYKMLRTLHCMKFNLMPDRVYRKIPHWVNHVVSAGRIIHPSIAEDRLTPL